MELSFKIEEVVLFILPQEIGDVIMEDEEPLPTIWFHLFFSTLRDKSLPQTKIARATTPSCISLKLVNPLTPNTHAERQSNSEA